MSYRPNPADFEDAVVENCRFVYDADNEMLRIMPVTPTAHLTVRDCTFWLEDTPIQVCFGEVQG